MFALVNKKTGKILFVSSKARSLKIVGRMLRSNKIAYKTVELV